MDKYGLTPEILNRVAEVGDKYIDFLYFHDIANRVPGWLLFFGVSCLAWKFRLEIRDLFKT